MNIDFGNRFQPHRLPNAADGRIPHTATGQGLLSVRILLLFQIVLTADGQTVLALAKRIGNIQAKCFIAAFVRAYRLAIEKHIRPLICRADVQQHAAPVEIFRQGEATGIAEQAALVIMLSDSGKTAFRAERNTDLAMAFIIHMKVPCAVQIHKAVPPHLGTGINIPGGLPCRQQLLAPFGHQINKHGHAPFAAVGTTGSAPQRSPPTQPAHPGKYWHWG